MIIDYNKPFLAFSNPFLKRYKCKIDWATDKLKIYPNGKEFVIPVTMHRVKNNIEVNHVVSSSQNTDQSVSKDEELKKSCMNCEEYCHATLVTEMWGRYKYKTRFLT